MKKLIYIPLFFFSLISSAQIDFDYEITVLDSFVCFRSDQVGMSALRAVNHTDEIHLTYIMQDTSSINRLMYGIRTSNGLQSEIIAALPADLLYGETALQFDQFGNPHIYSSHLRDISSSDQRAVYWYQKVQNVWIGSKVANTGYWPHLAADPDGSSELGFVFWSPNNPNWSSGQITYASFNGSNWEFADLSSDVLLPRTEPSIVKKNDRVYVTYGEGHCADTLITRVLVKENNNWSLDYEDVNLTPYGCGSIGGLQTRLGTSNNGVNLITSLRTDNGDPDFLKDEGQGWQQQPPIDWDASLTSPDYPSPNLLVSNDNTTYWINQAASSFGLSYIKGNSEGGRLALPLRDAILHDFVIKNNMAYIYYWQGSAAWPFNTPVTFKEIKVDLGQISTSVIDIESPSNSILYQNYPNPFDDFTSISFELKTANQVKLSVYDYLGREIATLVNDKLLAGLHQVRFNSDALPNGNYYYTMREGNNFSSKKMMICRR